jgi:hypothetical protein
MKLYKLTTEDHFTRKGKSGETRWWPHRTVTTEGRGGLCGPGYIHAYTHPLLAVFLNPIHADIHDPVLWECIGTPRLSDRGLKVGCTQFTTMRVIDLPAVTLEQRVRFAILCAQRPPSFAPFYAWAKAWLSGTDRTCLAAQIALAELRNAVVESGAAISAVKSVLCAADWLAELRAIEAGLKSGTSEGSKSVMAMTASEVFDKADIWRAKRLERAIEIDTASAAEAAAIALEPGFPPGPSHTGWPDTLHLGLLAERAIQEG